jgi:D-alanine-D-alanine ligase
MNANARLRICVLLGGPSAEREVSLRSGAAVAAALRAAGHEVSEVDAVGHWRLPPGTDVVFLALHGTYGEDGVVQSELEEMGVPYTGTDSEASRVAFDKVITKERLKAAGVPTAPWAVVTEGQAAPPAGLALPLVVKPVCQGSSVGLRFVERIEDWAGALAVCLEHDSRALVEERVIGREVTAGILEGRALPLLEIRPRKGAYDYHNKYTSGATEYLCPAPFPPEVTQRAQEAGLRAFEAVGGRDYGRVDIIIRPDGEPVVLEVNTLPGMTETSLLPKAAAAAGIGFIELCDRMAKLALKRGGREAGRGKDVA